jgi:hypothetical protein
VFAELILPSCTLAIGHTQTTQLFGTDSARPADNHTVIIEFRVEDVDSEYARLKPLVSDWVQEPTTMPWGNRSILFRDPDGNLVDFFTPSLPSVHGASLVFRSDRRGPSSVGRALVERRRREHGAGHVDHAHPVDHHGAAQ